jgi:DNA-binding NtrC family response regulator
MSRRPPTEGVPHAEATRDPAQPLPASLGPGRLSALYEISRQLLAARDPSAVIRGILAALVEHLEPERGAILAVGGDGGFRSLAAHSLELGPAPDEWPISLSVLRHVRDSGLAVLASDIQNTPPFKAAGSVQRFRIRSVLAVPLGPRPVRGAIYLDTRGDRRAFSAEDLEFVSALSVHASLLLDRAEEHARTSEALVLRSERLQVLQDELLRHEIVGGAPALLAAYDALRRLARAGARVLLRGETGTGKELFARAYAAASGRAGGGYVPVPIPALSPGLVESELFGHVRGAFTEATRDKKGRLELADKGVLFFDEVGDIDPSVQTKLLRFLDSGELFRVGDTVARRVDALVVSATNRPLEKDVEGGRFRGDLLARLGHVITVPPLRERPDDVPLLVEHFRRRYDREGKRFSEDALAVLRAHAWPFNVRELQQVVERAVCLVDHDVIGPEDLPDQLRPGVAAAARALDAGPPGPLGEVVAEAERRHVLRALEYTRGNRRKAMELLGISPETFYRRLEEYGLHKKGSG